MEPSVSKCVARHFQLRWINGGAIAIQLEYKPAQYRNSLSGFVSFRALSGSMGDSALMGLFQGPGRQEDVVPSKYPLALGTEVLSQL